MEYRTDVADIEADQLEGFFDGWPSRPTPARHLAILRGSSHIVLATEGQQITGFVTAISDGVMAAYIPLLEVRPAWRGRGIGSELVRRVLEALATMYMVDVVCDPELIAFYQRLGMSPMAGLGRRNRDALR